jgi:hypothetical protein
MRRLIELSGRESEKRNSRSRREQTLLHQAWRANDRHPGCQARDGRKREEDAKLLRSWRVRKEFTLGLFGTQVEAGRFSGKVGKVERTALIFLHGPGRFIG